MNALRLASFVLALGLSVSAVACDGDESSAGEACTGAACEEGSGGVGGADVANGAAPDCAADAAAVEAAKIAVVERRIAASNKQDWDTWQSLHTPGAVRTAPELDLNDVALDKVALREP